MSRFNLRQKPRISYYEPDEPGLDEYVFCDECGDYVYEYCSIHGPLLVVPDDKPPAVSPYPACVPRAALTIPHVFLHIARSNIPHAGLGVFTTLTLPRGVRFGPYRGQRVADADSNYCWQINDRNNRRSHLVDAADPNRSNWMRYVNCSRHWLEQNLVAFQYQGQLYYRTIKIIPRFTELLVFYGSEFAHMLHIDLKLYSSPRGYAQKLGAPLAKRAKLDSDNEILEEKGQKKSEIEEKKEENSTSNITDLSAPVMQEANTEKNNRVRKSSNTKTLIEDQNDSRTQSIQKPETVETKPKIMLSVTEPNCDINNNVDKIVFGKQYICDICSFSTNIIRRLEAHLKAHTASLCFSCDLCSYITSIKQHLASHLKTHSGKHMRIHTGEKPYVCNVCLKKFTESGSLKRHMRIHTGEKPYVCNVCNERFNLLGNLKTHMRIHTGEKPYVCNVCNVKFNRSSNLKRHMKIHTGEKRYVCNVCNVRFNRSSHLKTHMRIHTGEKPYVCNVCNVRFNESSHLKRHMRIHTGEKPYVCNVCNVRFNESSHLKRHMRIHTGEKPYACNVCNDRFNQLGSLKTHMRMHTGEKPYVCNVCNVKFNQLGSLKRHMRIHTGEKPYVCNVCNERFNESGNLKTHMRIHTGEKPYVCNVCNERFTRSDTLKGHMAVHTGE